LSATLGPVAPAPAPAAATEPAQHGPPLRTIGLAVGGVGVAGVLAGAVFGVLASSAKNDYAKDCGTGIQAPPNQCNAAGIHGHDDAVTKATLSTVFFVTGGALVAGGAALWFIGRGAASSSSVGIGPEGVTWRGTF
jgi:hypothetical protein